MNFNLDIAIFVGFLAINLVVGLFAGRGIKTVREYTLGNRNFSTATIAATIVATWISGGIFSITVTETYKNGLYFIIPLLGDALVFIIIGYFLAPRMAEFLGNLSVATAIGNLYGNNARLITAIVGVFGCAGEVAIQFKVSASILQMFFGVSAFYATVASSAVVILYSAFGGIRAVTFTDMIQFFTFGTIIPILALMIWGTLSDPYNVFHIISTNEIFDYKQVFDYHNSRFVPTLTLFLFYAIPNMYPVIFQRISMAKNTAQVTKSFVIAAVICFAIELIISWVGILVLSDNPNLDPTEIFGYIIDTYTYVGLKGVVIVGIMAMIMSTTDSYINTAAVLFAHDFCDSIGIKKTPNKLRISRIFSIFISIIALVLAFKTTTLLELGLLVWSFYIPIVTMPLLLAIFGFRSSSKTFLISATVGFTTVILWRIYLLDTGVDSVIPGMLANLVAFFASHYLLKQPGGWVGIKDERPLEAAKKERERKLQRIIRDIKGFNFLQEQLS